MHTYRKIYNFPERIKYYVRKAGSQKDNVFWYFLNTNYAKCRLFKNILRNIIFEF